MWRPLSPAPLPAAHCDSAINHLLQNIVLLPLRATGLLLQGRGPEILQAVTAGSWCRTHWGGRESMVLCQRPHLLPPSRLQSSTRKYPSNEVASLCHMPAEGKLRSFQKCPWKQTYKTGIRKAFYLNYLQTWSNQDNPGWRFKPFCCGKIIFIRNISIQGKISHTY